MIDRGADYHAALASASRQEVLNVLRASSEPLDASTVAARLGLHVTTARFHLDQLATAGLVHGRAGTENRRGRPRVLYSTAGPVRDDDSRDQLIKVLSAALALENDTDADASRAGRRWAKTFEVPDPEDPVPGLVEVFERIGFDPETDTEANTIRLRACPFRGAAREHPEVVCAVHRGLIEQLLEGTSPRAQLLPFVEPELCVVALDRHTATAAIG